MTEISLYDRVYGATLGVFIGDALGMPVETMTYDEIHKQHRLIDDYLKPDGHKWYDGWDAGHWTDDGQLTMAVIDSLMGCDGFNMDDIADSHVIAMRESDIGWGGSTKDSINRYKNDAHWSQSGSKKGAGNGVIMKMMPLVVYCMVDKERPKIHPISQLTRMTHNNLLSIHAAQLHERILKKCFSCDISRESFMMIKSLCYSLWSNQGSDLHKRVGDILAGFGGVFQLTDKQIVDHYDQGTCYVLNSLPFSYAFFFRDPHNIDTLYQVASAGGDTDSNASIVGSMLGALNGFSIFPDHLINGLWKRSEVVQKAHAFAEWIVQKSQK